MRMTEKRSAALQDRNAALQKEVNAEKESKQLLRQEVAMLQLQRKTEQEAYASLRRRPAQHTTAAQTSRPEEVSLAHDAHLWPGCGSDDHDPGSRRPRAAACISAVAASCSSSAP